MNKTEKLLLQFFLVVLPVLFGLHSLAVDIETESARVELRFNSDIYLMPGQDLLWEQLLDFSDLKARVPRKDSEDFQKMASSTAIKAQKLNQNINRGESQVADRELRTLIIKDLISLPLWKKLNPQLVFSDGVKIHTAKEFWFKNLLQQISQQINSHKQYSQITIDFDISKINAEELSPPYWDTTGVRQGSQILSYNTTNGKKTIPINVRVFRKVWVTQKSVRRSELVRSSDLELRDVEVTFRDDFESRERVKTMAWKRSLPANTPISEKDLQQVQVVSFGQQIEVLSGDGDFSVSLQGMAQRAGSVGELISVQLAGSKKIVNAKILNQTQAELQ